METQPDYTGRALWRITKDVAEIGVQRHEHSFRFNGSRTHYLIARSCEAFLHHCNRVMTFGAQAGCMPVRQIFVEENLTPRPERLLHRRARPHTPDTPADLPW